VNDQKSRSARLRYTATGALAALAAVGAIAGTAALAAKPDAKAPARVAVAKGGATKAPTSPIPNKAQVPGPPVNHQPFFSAVQQLVDHGTITATQGQAVDREIAAGRVDTDTLAGFTPGQVQAVQQALGNAKRALAATVSSTTK
jgi:hypothetical protein